MPSSSCVVEPLPFSLHVFLVQPYVALWRPLFTFPFWLAALAAECIVLDGCQHTLWSVFPVLYLMTWKQLKKHRCFSVGWAGRCSVYRSNLLVGFLPFSVAFKISSIETTEYGRLWVFLFVFLQVVNRVRKLIRTSYSSMSLEVPLFAYLHSSFVRKKSIDTYFLCS